MVQRSALSVFFLLFFVLSCHSPKPEAATNERPPNVVVIFMDDMGYGDLSVMGHPTIHTPNIDRLAQEGQLWTSFYTASSVCSPSRGALLTGRYPIRIGLAGPRRRVFFPKSKGGLPQDEITIAEMLKAEGYKTGIIGKWHLGHLPEHLPMTQGFDYYYGIPYSNDMDGVKWGIETLLAEPADTSMWQVPLMENEQIIERPADQYTITKRYTEKAVDFMTTHREAPFFLYLPHSMVHTPLFAGPDFQGTNPRGRFGDVMREIDWSVGQVMETLDRLQLAENTLVVFTSDNGPWLSMLEHGGSAGLLRDGKGTTWEGGMRVPGIFRMPGTVAPGRITDMGSTLDLLPTVAALTGAKPPADRPLDGYDLSGVLRNQSASPRNEFFYYRKAELYAARQGPYKMHYVTETCYTPDNGKTEHPQPLLFQLEHDPSEKYDHADRHPEIVSRIENLVAAHKGTVEMVPPEMEKY
ncbi:MAG: arylsulfatase A [Neolewinella sp.]|jgi:arylsulfatase A-like enzyme